MLNAIIFDCFDVLYPDYADNYIDRHPELFKNGLNFRDKLFRQIDLGEISQAQLYESLENITGSPAEEIKTEMESELKPDLNLISLIKRLKTKYKIGLISNAGEEEISIIYKDGLDILFDAITVSYELQNVKPNLKIYNTCLQRLGVSANESIYIDDNIKNIQAAKKMSMEAVQ